MSIQNKPDYKVFASDAKSGEIETFPDILRGWGVTIDRTGEIPPMEWFNAIGKRVDEWLLYLTQRGIPEWDSSLDYPKTAITQFNNVFYVSTKATKGEQPDRAQASWSTLSSFLGLGNYYNKSESDATFQSKGNYADGNSFKVSSSSATMAPSGGAASLAVEKTGDIFLWDGSKSVFRISSTGEVTVGNVPYARLTGVPITQTTGSSTTSFMSQKAVTDSFQPKGNYQPAGSYYNKSESDATFQPKGNYADGNSFRVSASNTAISPVGGVTTLIVEKSGDVFTWDGNKSVFRISSAGEITLGSMDYSRLKSVPLVQTTGSSATSFMSQKAVTDAMIGVGQELVDVKNQRSLNTVYTNTSGKPIFVSVTCGGQSKPSRTELFAGDVLCSSYYKDSNSDAAVSAIIPKGVNYIVKSSSGVIFSWTELK